MNNQISPHSGSKVQRKLVQDVFNKLRTFTVFTNDVCLRPVFLEVGRGKILYRAWTAEWGIWIFHRNNLTCLFFQIASVWIFNVNFNNIVIIFKVWYGNHDREQTHRYRETLFMMKIFILLSPFMNYRRWYIGCETTGNIFVCAFYCFHGFAAS